MRRRKIRGASVLSIQAGLCAACRGVCYDGQHVFTLTRMDQQTRDDLDAALRRARPEHVATLLVDAACRLAGAAAGALFVRNRAGTGLMLVHHVVGGKIVTLPDTVVRGDSPGLAQAAFTAGSTVVCPDTSKDARYTRYLLDVGSLIAVPIGTARRPIGVLTVAHESPGTFGRDAVVALENLARMAAPTVQRAELDRQSREATGRPFLIRGLSPAWLAVEQRIELAGPSHLPILIRGESGTGKDLVARAMHANSLRAGGPFVVVNCAAIPEALLESTLFGHVRGAFTGAMHDKLGEFQKADGGTLFLDEVGELPLALQAKVLRAVEGGEIAPLGTNQAPRRVDVRLVCATNRPLEEMCRVGTFREDLFYRVSVMPVELPALRQYRDSLEVLASVFLEQAARQHKRRAPRLGAEALAALMGHPFPGNVRELKHAMEHALVLCTRDEISSADLPATIRAVGRSVPATAPASLAELRERWLAPREREYLIDLVNRHRGNVRAAAVEAGVDHVTLYRLLKKRAIHVARRARAV